MYILNTAVQGAVYSYTSSWYIYMLLLAGLLGAGGSGTDCNVFGAVQLRYVSG